MTIRLTADGTIELDGVCPLEDGEKLQQFLISDPDATVDWRACAAAHAAVIQILLAVKPDLRGPAGSDFLRNHIEPLLQPPAV